MKRLDTSINRRVHARHALCLEVRARNAHGTVNGRSEDFSVGGAKVYFDETAALTVGEHVEMQVALPGSAQPLKARAELRWRGGKGAWGVAFDRKTQAVLTAFFAAMCGLTSGTATAATAVPTFDPNADVVLEDTGGERPDEYTIEAAFKAQNDALDQCAKQVEGAKKGNAKVEVLLNPKGNRPLGVNAQLPSGLRNNTALRECVRAATAAAAFPAYDGPPVVVDLDFKIDPGSDYEEVW